MMGRRGRTTKVLSGGGVKKPEVTSASPEVLAVDTGRSGNRLNRNDVTNPQLGARAEVPSLPKQPPAVKRGRGRPPTSSSAEDNGGGVDIGGDISWIRGKLAVSGSIMKKLAKSLPEHEDDEEEDVMCWECRDTGVEMNYRKFRLHNIQYHMNTSVTVDEKNHETMDHKFFARRLNEFKKLTKATVFECPRLTCTSNFKSTLGLAYHMNTCGRSPEELEAVLIECDLCHAKLSLPNLPWHKKSHEREQVSDHPVEQLRTVPGASGRKRASAIEARLSLRRMGTKSQQNDTEDDDDEETGEVYEDQRSLRNPSNKSQLRVDKETNDFCCLAIDFLEATGSEKEAWGDPARNDEDPFINMADNQLDSIADHDELKSYLPLHKQSIEFKCVTNDEHFDYHRLTWFEGETVASSASTLANKTEPLLIHTGGPVLSMSWHPSGKLLAVSTGKDCKEEVNSLMFQERRSAIQIYSCSPNKLSLRLLIGIRWGFATSIQWSSFCPDIMDSYKPHDNFQDVDIYCRIGYLAMACEDSTIRILAIRTEDLKRSPNYEYKPGQLIPVYSKNPEICLKLDDSTVDEDLGNVTKFDWHEKNKYLAAGYANGTVAVYDLETKSQLLRQTILKGNNKITVINPFWIFQAHRLPIRGLCFDPETPRYLVTAGQDRSLKIWDLQTRMLRDTKRVGICLDMCWIRGWMHQAVSVENHVAYQSSVHNYVRVYSVGSGIGRPTSAEHFNATCLDFYHGLTAQGTEDGKVNATYFDYFWRECDYDRNRKKKNLAILSTIELDPASYTKITNSDFSVTVKKLRRNVYTSKAYQRFCLNEEDKVYSAMLEAKFSGKEIFDSLPDVDNDSPTDSDGDFDVEKVTQEDVVMVSEVQQPKHKDGLIPLYDVNIPNEEPKLIISFVKERHSSLPSNNIGPDKLEEYVRFQHFIRINKVSWSPNGAVLAVGYRNGLVSLIPGTFEEIFAHGR